MITLRLSVPIACWRKGHARELLESESIPPPATVYGALLSLVGEEDRARHVGARVTAGLLNTPERSQVLRSLWRVKDKVLPPGTGNNVKPDFQQLLTNSEVLVLLDSADEPSKPSLEDRVRRALNAPATVERHGGWSLGESTHLINDVTVLAEFPAGAMLFLSGGKLEITLPVWVDHVGSAGTRYVTGEVERLAGPPLRERIPSISSA